MAYPHPRETLLNDHLRHREMEAQRYLARAKDESLPDWRRVLQELTARTPRYMKGVVRVLMPKVASDVLLNPDAEHSLWDIRSRTQCYMVIEQERDSGGNTVLKISGTRTAVEKAIDDIVQVTKKVRVLLLSDGDEILIHDGIDEHGADPYTAKPRMPISIGQTRSLDESLNPTILTTTAQDVPKPSRWTKQTFEQYVATLARGYLPVWRANILYPDRKAGHQHAVVKQLVDVFYDPEAQSSLSGAAFKIAFEYIARRGRVFRTQARVLFDRMERLGVPTDTTIYNLLIEATIHDKDLRSFSACVSLMLRRGHEPNLKTWLLFLRLVQSEEVRRYILQAMIHKNLLVTPENMAQVALEMARYDAERAMQHGLDVETLLAEQSKLYGPDWLRFSGATTTCNLILEVIAKHGKWDQVNKFVDFMASRPSPYVYPDANTLNICVEHARVQTYARLAIDLVGKFEDLGIQTEMGTLQSLFMAFWDHNMAHAMDIVWQFALLTGRTTTAMAIRFSKVLRLGSRSGWDAPIPTQSDTVPPTKRPKWYGMYALLMASSRDMFQVEKPATQRQLLRVLRQRGLQMRSEGYIVPRGSLSRTLRDMAERDSRFHKSLTEKKWIIEPALLSITLRTDEADAPHKIIEEDDIDEDCNEEESQGGEISTEQLEKHQDIEI
ncbi:hypothetical protein CONLIGDRAFT_686574 [Coniochaeta ligniaria NRRL 30616]|uniref:Pentatricopeptide repeat protein n=1 Tax=Coniochaeta ligniaria NRRL 30616 TaxID=1408157 RepID=A0A1J7I887_9PEZI|nr:hypothetical protein CONLIGDRAFT_686574 [Coniochaeta ligniaria NRRL 30616]